MKSRDQWRQFFDMPIVEWSMFAAGELLIIAGLLIAPLPGPGGIFLIAPGAALVLKTSIWAKRRYVKFKRWQPKVLGKRLEPGSWTDMALRRRSARRRLKLQKEREAQGLPPLQEEADGPVEALVPDAPLTPPETWADREGRAHRDRSAN